MERKARRKRIEAKKIVKLGLFQWSDQLIVAANHAHAVALLVDVGTSPDRFISEPVEAIPDDEPIDLVEADDDGEYTRHVRRKAAAVVRLCGRAMILPDASDC